MPIYEYECTKCGCIEEVIQKFSDRCLVKCRHCSGKLQKLISPSSFHLKGSGWYVTDYAGKSHGSPSSDKKKEGASTTEAKAADKATEKTS